MPDHLPVVQQSLLIYHTASGVTLHTIANILGITLEELKNTLSKLHSVLTPERERDWG